MSDKISVNCQAKLSEVITKISAMYKDKKFVVVTLRAGKDRTLDQNRLWFGMYKRIAEMTQIGEPGEGAQVAGRYRPQGAARREGEDQDARPTHERGAGRLQCLDSRAGYRPAVRKLRPAPQRPMARRALPHCRWQPRASLRAAERVAPVRAVQQPQVGRHCELPAGAGEANRRRKSGLAGRAS